MDYFVAKTVHQTAVVLSVSGFCVRWVLALHGSPHARTRLARTLPHVVDTVLLGSALVMLALWRLNPLAQPWLVAKLCGLVAYIGLGVVALRSGNPRAVRAAAGCAALVAVAWIVSVAVLKRPSGFFGAG